MNCWLLICLITVGLGSLIFFFNNCGLCTNFIFRKAYSFHQQLRRAQRPSRIIIVRHGESEANVDPTLCSRMADHYVALTEKGHAQAIAAGEKIKSIVGKESVYVYMSPYRRSKETWKDIRTALSPLQIITEREDPRLREQEFGNLADLNKIQSQFEERDRLGHFFYRFSCGESGADVYDRVSLFLDTLFREMDNGHHDPTQNIIIVSHGLFMRLFLMRYFRWTVEELEKVKDFENCELVQLTKTEGVYTLDNGSTRPPTKSS